MTLADKLKDDLRQRRQRIRAGGGAEKMAARRDKGLLTARDRVEALCQPHSFQESGAHVAQGGRQFGMAGSSLPPMPN